MLVYRVCSTDELTKLFNNKEVGSPFNIDNKLNTHQYKENTNYMHFFFDKKDTLYIYSDKGDLLVTYDIPDEYISYEGIGYYWEQLNFNFLVDIKELAIPSSLITYKNVSKIEAIKEHMYFEDFIYNGLDYYLEETDIKKLVKH